MIFIAPKLHAAPEDLANLKLPPQSQNTVLAQWHIFPWGPLKNNGKYPWTSGTAAEKAAIRACINTAIHWQQKTGHVSWVGAGRREKPSKTRLLPRKWRLPALWRAS
jgi:hypothetical protein